MKRLLQVIVLGAILCLPVGAAAGSGQSSEEQTLYADALRLMRERDYSGAADVYDKLVNGSKDSPYRDIYQYGLGQARYFLSDFAGATQALAAYHLLYPGSYLGPYAHHLRANCFYRLKRLDEAFGEYVRAYETAADGRLHDLAKESLAATVDAGYLPPDSMLSMMPPDLACIIKARLVSHLTGLWTPGALDSLYAGCPPSLLNKDRGIKRSEGRPLIGIMVPLTGPYAGYGQTILDGAMLAAEAANRDGLTMDLAVYDTKADNVVAARQAVLLSEAGADLVVGPLLSDVAATVAAALSCSRTPLIVPAATQADFPGLSPVCFQLSTNVVAIGRGMAQYAVTHRGMKTLAVIAPATLDEMTMAEAFADEARRLGAWVPAVEKFRPGETDFGPYLTDLKNAILGSQPDSSVYITLAGDTLDRMEVPVSLDGLFIPATADQLIMLLPQIIFYQISASYLGADEWNTDRVLRLEKNVLRDAVFYSAGEAIKYSAGYEKFAAVYSAKFGVQPDRLAAVGYDAVSLFADARRAGYVSREQLAEYLGALDGYEGASGRVSFGRNRTNLELPLFTLIDGQMRPVAEKTRWEEPAPIEEETEEQYAPDSVGGQIIKFKP